MPLFSRGPDLSSVREDLVRVLKNARGKGANAALSGMRQIITPDVAAKADTWEGAKILAGDNIPGTMPADVVDPYLYGLVSCVQQRLGRDSDNIRFMAANTGNVFHGMLGNQYLHEQNFSAAEEELRKGLEFLRLESSENASIAQAMANIGRALHWQDRWPEAHEMYADAVAMFDSLSPSSLSYQDVRPTIDSIRQYV